MTPTLYPGDLPTDTLSPSKRWVFTPRCCVHRVAFILVLVGWLQCSHSIPTGVAGQLWLEDLHSVTPVAISGETHSLTGRFIHDTEVHVYSFVFKPWMTYSLMADTGTLWDVALAVIPPDSTIVYRETNSTWTGSAAASNLVHQGAVSRWHLVVRPMFAFTTGTYHLAIWQDAGQDVDGDGIADAWELHHFGNLSAVDADSDVTGKGFGDRQTYLAGLNPGEALKISSFAPDPSSGGYVLGWSMMPHGVYDLYTATNLPGSWSVLRSWTSDPAGMTAAWTNTPPVDKKRFYKIRLRSE